MKLSYLMKNCSPVWTRIIEPASFEKISASKVDFTRLDSSIDSSMVNRQVQSHDPEITSIHANASEVTPGGLFIAIKGFKVNGHDYIGQAIANGAAAIITQQKIGKKELADAVISNSVSEFTDHILNPVMGETLPCSVVTNPVVIEVQDTRKAMSTIAARFYGNPSDSMTLIGITGTNGKTTTSFLIESILKAAGYKTGVIGTVNYRYNNQSFENSVTTPESIDLHRILAQMQDAGVTHVVMEVSSHAIDLHRVRDCEFDVGVFTNLTQDHLDYHKTMSAYFACKKTFFTKQLKRGKKAEKSVAVINVNDSYGQQLIESGLKISIIAVGTNRPTNSSHAFNNIWSSNIKDDISGLQGNLHINSEDNPDNFIKFKSKLTGLFNLENILCAAGAAHAVGISAEIIRKGIESCGGVPGRLERVENPNLEYSQKLLRGDSFERYVFVDYAHTPDALESILKTLKMRAPARLISIFGCGGDRDKTKRPIMGEIAYRYSDITIITSDNPRSEDPDTIINEILKGIPERDLEKIIVEPDRAKALEIAVNISEPNDIIVAAGKGHETYQITAQGKIDFDDRVILKYALSKLFYKKAKFSQKPILWSVADILNALEISESGSSFKEISFTSVSTDSRAITKNELFVALKGERFDGHNFIFDLINRGVRGFVVGKEFCENLTPQEKNEINEKNIHFFPVDDTLTALGMLARFQRIRSGVKVLAITGSNGKTTTRRMTASIFEQHFRTLSTQGNLNNEIGVPMTLLKLSNKHEWAVIEMGMNHSGEISRLSKIACPDIAIITNTTDAHLEGLGTVDDVARAKAEIIEGLNPKSTIVINSDDPRWQIIADKAYGCNNIADTIFFGSDKLSRSDCTFESDTESNPISRGSHLSAINVVCNQDGIAFSLCNNSEEEQKYYDGFRIMTPARFMLSNALAASAAAFAAKIPINAISKGLLMFEPAVGRMKIIDIPITLAEENTDGEGASRVNRWLHIIDDTYNANPGSVKAALETLKYLSKGQKSIAVLGDMLELGEQSTQLHFKIGQESVNAGIASLYAHGDMALEIVRGAKEAIKIDQNGLLEEKILHGTKGEIIESLLKYIKNIEKGQTDETDTWILIKGSRGMKMEIVVEALIRYLNIYQREN